MPLPHSFLQVAEGSPVGAGPGAPVAGAEGNPLGQGANGPMSYAVGGTQYVAVSSGNGLFVFALRD